MRITYSILASLAVLCGVVSDVRAAFGVPPAYNPGFGGYQWGYQGPRPRGAFGGLEATGNVNPNMFNEGDRLAAAFAAPNRAGVNANVDKARRILARWKNLVDDNENDPEQITDQFSVLKKEMTVVASALRVMRASGVAPQVMNEYLILADLLRLAGIRQFTQTLPDVKRDFLKSYRKESRKGLNERKSKKEKVSEDDTGAGQAADWYRGRTALLRGWLESFVRVMQVINQQNGGNPPPMLVGARESLETASRETLPEYEKMVAAIEHTESTEAIEFKNELKAENPDKDTGRGRNSRDDNDDDDDDDDDRRRLLYGRQ